MHVTQRTAVLTYVGVFAVLLATLGALVAGFISAFVGLGAVVGLIGHSAFVALRNWQLDTWPSRGRIR